MIFFEKIILSQRKTIENATFFIAYVLNYYNSKYTTFLHACQDVLKKNALFIKN